MVLSMRSQPTSIMGKGLMQDFLTVLILPQLQQELCQVVTQEVLLPAPQGRLVIVNSL